LFIAIIFLLGLAFLFINKEIAWHLWQQVSSGFKTHYDFFSLKEGMFIDTYQFFNIGYSFFCLPFGILTALSLVKEKKNNQVLIYLLICSLIVSTKFIFYKRVFIFLDISLLIFFGHSFAVFIEKIKLATSVRYVKIFFIILLFFPTVLFFINVINQKPLISQMEMKNIENYKLNVRHLKIFTYSSVYMPWLYGFSGHKIIAPGWGDNGWDLKKWGVFWGANMKNKKEMLLDFRPPFLIYDNGDGFFQLKKEDCFSEIGNNLYLFYCQ
jgi:hypothetical protein